MQGTITLKQRGKEQKVYNTFGSEHLPYLPQNQSNYVLLKRQHLYLILLTVGDDRVHRSLGVHAPPSAAGRLHLPAGRVPARRGERLPQGVLRHPPRGTRQAARGREDAGKGLLFSRIVWHI